jgi:hypothetical protein
MYEMKMSKEYLILSGQQFIRSSVSDVDFELFVLHFFFEKASFADRDQNR